MHMALSLSDHEGRKAVDKTTDRGSANTRDVASNCHEGKGRSERKASGHEHVICQDSAKDGSNR